MLIFLASHSRYDHYREDKSFRNFLGPSKRESELIDLGIGQLQGFGGYWRMVCRRRPGIAAIALAFCSAETLQGLSPYVRGGVTPNATFLGHSVSLVPLPSLLIESD